MDLDNRLKDRLVGYLRAELPKVRMNKVVQAIDYSDVFALDKGFSALLQKANKEVREQVEYYVGERPLVALVLGEFSREIEQMLPQDVSGRATLCDIPQYSNVEALANRIVEMLAALPRKYVVALELPVSWAKVLYTREIPPILGRQLAVVGSWHDASKEFPIPGIERSATSIFNNIFAKSTWSAPSEARGPDSPRCFLYVRLEGLVDSVFSPQPTHRFTNLVKAFFGLAMGIDLLLPTISLGAGALRYDVYEEREGAFGKVEDGLLDDGTRALASKLRINHAESKNISADFQKVIQILDADPELPQLALGGRWYFDSFANSDEVMGFMQLAICAETLLGTDDGADGVTGILASRCGYLIATSAKERDDLVSEFRSIYKVRSKIVHRGLGALKESERQQLRRLRVICSRILQKEVDLAIADLPDPEKWKDLHQTIDKFAAAIKGLPLLPSFESGSSTGS